ncbi:hypothetical protein TrCOL_g2606 [Triparma columacea]|uniref:Prolyl 4-hydroxylase alpha subunit domain-containing protein n=1 Tax=Triparma columacea TaxID=722753 RepID=A0A9W7GEF5_9STRA|nr:hypothetical protein TrCOL_g2606 [Triparma columacea]
MLHEHVQFLNEGSSSLVDESVSALLSSPWLLSCDRPDISSLTLSQLELPIGSRDDFAAEIRGVLSKKECRHLIECTDALGYETATVSTHKGQRQALNENFRKSDRCMIDSDQIVEEVFSRIRHLLPKPSQILQLKQETQKWRLDSINRRLRFLRYDEGGFFNKHKDGYFEDETEEGVPRRSFVTIQIYLNDGGGVDFTGGGTSFWSSSGSSCTCTPEAGKVLLFSHPHLHSGDRLKGGRKYVIRSDIMYAKEV